MWPFKKKTQEEMERRWEKQQAKAKKIYLVIVRLRATPGYWVIGVCNTLKWAEEIKQAHLQLLNHQKRKVDILEHKAPGNNPFDIDFRKSSLYWRLFGATVCLILIKWVF